MINIPKDFEEYTRILMGEDLYRTLIKGLKQEDCPTSIRINPFKRCAVNMDLVSNNVPWCKDGYYLKERPTFTFDPLFHAGSYYVQEASSMFIDHIIRQYIHYPVTALDLCAAPGGKSTCAQSAFPIGSTLIANEPITKRAQILSENILKFGHSQIAVTNNFPKDFKKTKLLFDIIIADVPCSGEGMFRKDPKAISSWSKENVKKCCQLQRSIIKDIWDNLKEGGFLIYSTCTFNSLENEENVAWIIKELGAKLLPIHTEKEWNITGSLIGNPLNGADSTAQQFPVYRFLPGKTLGEGLFICLLQKTKPGLNPIPSNNISLLQKDYFRKALKPLKLLAYGVNEPEEKGKNKIPHISQALMKDADNSLYPTIDVSYHTAIAYLRGEAITLSHDIPHGIILLTYKNQPLGYAKNIGNRANNLYPQEWRIRSTYVPKEPNIIL